MRKNHYTKYGLLFILLLATLTGFAQTGNINGTVLDETQQPLPGVTVSIKNTTMAVATDVSGHFNLTNVEPGKYTLQASFVGYGAILKDITVAGNSLTVNFTLTPEQNNLNEVVVIGYGTQKRKDLTGSVATVTSKDFVPGAITSPQELISGKVAGVQVISDGGAPGSATHIRIRGGASLNASNDPLIVIDGVPVDNNGISGAGDALSMINPNDIESFNILKDASATAIYGTRASNGVIMITTKKGNAGGNLKVNFNSTQSLSEKTREVPVLTADQYRDELDYYIKNVTGANTSAASLLGTANTDWQNAIYHTAFRSDNNISFEGGVKGLPYRLSVGYLNEDGILKTSNFNRLTGALTLNPKFLHDDLSVNLNLKGTVTKSRFANTGAIGSAVAFNPTEPIYADDPKLGGYFEWTNPDGSPTQLAGKNPVSMLNQEHNNARADRSIGNLQLDYKFPFLRDLHANVNAGYDVSRSNGIDVLPATLASSYAIQGSSSNYAQNKTNKLLDFYLFYTKTIGDNHIDATVGYSYQDWITSTPSTVLTPGLGKPTIYTPTKTQNTLIGYFGRVNYSYKDRYLFTASIRDDGSSRFAPENRQAWFPSAAFAWDIQQESFLKDSKTLSALKLRLGYGITGQQDLLNGDYPYLARYTNSDNGTTYPLGDNYYNLLRASGYDADIKWEQTATYNAGVDFGFLNGRLSGSLDYYIKKTKNLLSLVNVPEGANLTNILLINVGNIEDKGLEFNLNAIPVKTQNFNWSLNLNATHYDSKVTNLTITGANDKIGVPAAATSFIGTSLQYNTVGYTPNTFFVAQQKYDAQGKPIEGSYVDVDGNGVIDENDFHHYKSAQPTYILGFSSNMTYKQWDFGFTMRANLGQYDYNSYAANTGYYNGLAFANFLGNVSSDILNTKFVANQSTSDYYVQKASFLRMDNVNLGYTFKKISDKVTLKLAFNVQNVFVVTPYKGLDPEVFNGIDNNFYPRPRIYSLGLNMGF